MSAYVTAKAAADLTGRSEKTIRNWIKSGKLRAEKGGRDYRIDLADLARVCPLITAAVAPNAEPPFPEPDEPAEVRSRGDGLPEAAEVLAAVVRLLDALGERDRQIAALYAERAELVGEVQALAARTRSLEEDVRRLKSPRGLLHWRRPDR